jgi:2-hydroxymuconate-semialdehyde hydrolase
MADEQFNHAGTTVAYSREGAGFPLLMIHGSGPGASSYGNWAKVLAPLAQHFEVYAMDLIGFGKSGRKPSPPYFDFPLWVDQAREMLRRIPGERVGVIGHSISGAIALKLAASESRIARVMTTGTMGASFIPTDSTIRCWTCPTSRESLRRTAEGLIYDRTTIDEPYLAAREKILFAPGYAEYFNTMFAGNKMRYVDATTLSAEELAAIGQEVLMVHGREDGAFPPQPLTLTLSAQIKRADAVLLARCSHSVAFEHPHKFIDLAVSFFQR